MLRDGATGDWIGTFIGHKGACWQARVSADAKLAVTGSADFSAKVWDTHTGEALHTLQHNHIVRAVAFPSSPSPTILATGGAEKKLRIWDLTRSSDGAVPNGSNAGEISSYEIGAGVHQGTIRSILWAPNDPNVLVTAADDKKIRWWDLRDQKMAGEHALNDPINSCELNTKSPTTSANGVQAVNGTTSASGSVLTLAAGKSIYLFDKPFSPSQPSKVHTLSQEVSSCAVNLPAQKFVIGSGSDTWVHVHDLATGEELEVGKGHHGPVWSVCFSPDGRIYATGSEDGTVKLWKFGEGGYGLWR